MVKIYLICLINCLIININILSIVVLQDGGGIKTKLVEALGFGKICISSQNGAIGVDAAYTGGRLTIVADKDWRAYSEAITHQLQAIANDNAAFYKHFSWQNIAMKAVDAITMTDVK